MVISYNPSAFLFAVLGLMEIQKLGCVKALAPIIILLILLLNYVFLNAHKVTLPIKLKKNVISSVLTGILAMKGNALYNVLIIYMGIR